MKPPVVCIKIGGRAMEETDSFARLLRDIAELSVKFRFVFVHGGGAEVTRLSSQLGLKSIFVDGVRMTSAREMEVVDMVLAGKLNKNMVRRFFAAGIEAVGLSGSDGAIFLGERLNDDTCTGRVIDVRVRLLHALIEGGWTPVIASTSMDPLGMPININGDEAAFAVASGLPASQLLFISDVPGVLKDDAVISSMNPKQAREEIQEGTIFGGMIPKVESALDAIGKGVESVKIGDFQNKGDISALLDGTKGTTIKA